MMIIVWGFKVRFSKVRAVTFVCSHCGADREGTLRRARRWFTIFFIPIVPTRELGLDVQCGTCKNRFAPRILDVATTAQSTEHLANAYRCGLVVMVRASGNSASSRGAAVSLMRDRNQLYDIETLDLDLANTTDAQVDAWLSHLSVMLNQLGKERSAVDTGSAMACSISLSSNRRPSGHVPLPELGEVEVGRWCEQLSGQSGCSKLVDADDVDARRAQRDHVPRALLQHQAERSNDDRGVVTSGEFDLAPVLNAAGDPS